MNTNDNPDKTFDELDLEQEIENEEEEQEEGTETEGGDDPSSGSDDVEDPEEGSDDDGDDPSDDPMAKFKGKSAEEVIEMYKNLEHRIDSEALKKAQEILKGNAKPVPTKKKKGDEEEDDFDLTEEQIKKMTPQEFAKWTDKRIATKATEIARNMIERSNQVRDNVKKEIKEVVKSHPHLKTNTKYREIVLDRIEAAKARGKTLTLTEACKQVDEAMDIKAKKEGDEEKPKKKPRTAVEKQEGGDGNPPKTDEEKVIEGMMNAGGKSTGKLGGLGI